MANHDDSLATVKKLRDLNEVISKEEFIHRVKEIKHCKEDIIYFAEKYFRIVSLKDGLTIIKTFPKQREMINFMKDNKRVVCLSSRQSGKTTSYTVYCLWTLCFFPDKAIMIAANKAATAIEIMGRIRRAYEYLPEWLKPAVMTYNKSEVVYSNNSKMHAFATASDACRGFSANIVILDEFSWVPQNVANSFFASVYPVVSTDPNSHVIVVSTPHGTVNNLYYDLWQQANQDNDLDDEHWKPFRMDWWEVPDRDETWKKRQIAAIGIDRFRTEFGNEFIAGATSRLMPDSVIEQQQKLHRDGHMLHIKSLSGNTDWIIRIYHRCELGHVYVAGADIAEGSGGDSSCLIILDITNIRDIKVAALFSSPTISITEFAALSARLLNAYNLPLLLAENNGVGAGYLSMLNDTYKYPTLLSYTGDTLGIHSSTKSKLDACLWLRELMTSDELKFSLYNQELISELSHFSKTDSRNVINYCAPKKMHDDLVMTLIWAVFLLKPDLLKFGVNVIKTGKTKLGVEIPTVIAFDAMNMTSLPAFDKDRLPYMLLTMLADIEAEWYSPENADHITTVIQSNVPIFVVNNGQSIDLTTEEDDGPMW